MTISSRTPDGSPNECPICGHSIVIVPSPTTLDAPCPYCGHLLWFVETGPVPIWDESAVVEQSTDVFEMPGAIQIAARILESVPESTVRESLVIPITESSDALLVAVVAPVRLEILEKLQFILNRPVLAVPTTRNWIVAQIDKHYGAMTT